MRRAAHPSDRVAKALLQFLSWFFSCGGVTHPKSGTIGSFYAKLKNQRLSALSRSDLVSAWSVQAAQNVSGARKTGHMASS
jgi:hypothetical protein